MFKENMRGIDTGIDRQNKQVCFWTWAKSVTHSSATVNYTVGDGPCLCQLRLRSGL